MSAYFPPMQTARQQVADKQRAEREMEEKARKNKELSAVKVRIDTLDTTMTQLATGLTCSLLAYLPTH